MTESHLAETLPPSVLRVQNWLDSHAHGHRVTLLSESGRTAQEAADALGVDVAQIAKSLVFALKSSASQLPPQMHPEGSCVLILASGRHRVDEAKVVALLEQHWGTEGLSLGKADAKLVRQWTGFAIGGIPPVAHERAMPVVMDASLLDWPGIWAAAGSPHAVFALTAPDLQRWTNAVVGEIHQELSI